MLGHQRVPSLAGALNFLVVQTNEAADFYPVASRIELRVFSRAPISL